MAIELAITDETPATPAAQGLSEQDILDCFLGTPMQGSYRDYLVNAGRAIEAMAVQPICGNCDARLPSGCGGIFRDDGAACALNGARA